MTLVSVPILSLCTDKEIEAQKDTGFAQDHIASRWQNNMPLTSDCQRELGWPKSQGQTPCLPSLSLEDGYSFTTHTQIPTMLCSTCSSLSPGK